MLSSRWATKPEDEQPPSSAPPPVAAPEPALTPQVTAEVPPPEPEPAMVESEPAPATTELAYDYSYSDSIDPFAQTAGTDDLFFDDDFVPVAEPVIEQNPEPTPPEPEEVAPPSGLAQSQHQHISRASGNGDRGGRGAGRGRGGRGGRGRGRGAGPHTVFDGREKKEEKDKEEDNKDADPIEASTEPNGATQEAASAKEAKPPTSVRGDRTLTGGPKRSRLTEEELNAKLASMRSKNESLQAAHARAEADLANFEAREALAAKQMAERKRQLAERQKHDRQNRQQMMGEREKNRQRKLDAVQGREWDIEKEEGFSGTGEERRSGASRGAHGGVVPSARRPTDEPPNTSNEDWAFLGAADDASGAPAHRGRGRGRGRGGRGNRGGRGDHHATATPSKKPKDQQPPSASDFPDLPPTKTVAPDTAASGPKVLDFPIKTKTSEIKASDAEHPGIKKQDSFGLPSPAAPGKSWADQVEGS